MDDKAMKQDVDRMIAFIYHESKEKVNELNIKAHEEYNVEKERIIAEKTLSLKRDFEERVKSLESKRFVELSKVKKQQKMWVLHEKEKIINALFEKVEERLKSARVTEKLCKACGEMPDAFVLCKDEDRGVVKKCLGGEPRTLDAQLMGGVVLCSKDGKVVCDNSFLTRLDAVKERCMCHVSAYLFGAR